MAIISLLIITCFGLVACNSSEVEIPQEYRGTYRNIAVGSSWNVSKNTLSTPQAMLYNYKYNFTGKTYSTFIIGETKEFYVDIRQNVNKSDTPHGMKAVDEFSNNDISAANYIADGRYYNTTAEHLSIYGYTYNNIVNRALVIEGCLHYI